MAVPNNIILSDGVFSIGSTPIALTRGGGKFTLEREYRTIEADGDFGKVKGRVRCIKSEAKLVMNALEIIPANLKTFYPAMALDTSSSAGHSIITGTLAVVDADFNTTVSWSGYTKAGKAVVITLNNAINLENIDWALVDKEEVIAELTYTACYAETARSSEVWSINFDTST